jgi:hypothetical protein
MVISDPIAHKIIAKAPIGAGPDGVVCLDGYAISANGRDGTVSIIGEVSPGRFEAVGTVAVARGARTIAADRSLHKLFLPTADFGPPADQGQKTARPEAVPGSFKVVVISAH